MVNIEPAGTYIGYDVRYFASLVRVIGIYVLGY